MNYPFTEADMQTAHDEWGCNCGPSALAFALQIRLDQVRGKIPGFEERRYASPTMMRGGLVALGVRINNIHPDKMRELFAPQPALMRIQWTGPWTQPGANPKWAYRQSHWICTWLSDGQADGFRLTAGLKMVFDCNGGIRTFEGWENEIVPLLTAMYPRADGGWYATHVWRVKQ